MMTIHCDLCTKIMERNTLSSFMRELVNCDDSQKYVGDVCESCISEGIIGLKEFVHQWKNKRSIK